MAAKFQMVLPFSTKQQKKLIQNLSEFEFWHPVLVHDFFSGTRKWRQNSNYSKLGNFFIFSIDKDENAFLTFC